MPLGKLLNNNWVIFYAVFNVSYFFVDRVSSSIFWPVRGGEEGLGIVQLIIVILYILNYNYEIRYHVTTFNHYRNVNDRVLSPVLLAESSALWRSPSPAYWTSPRGPQTQYGTRAKVCTTRDRHGCARRGAATAPVDCFLRTVILTRRLRSYCCPWIRITTTNGRLFVVLCHHTLLLNGSLMAISFSVDDYGAAATKLDISAQWCNPKDLAIFEPRIWKVGECSTARQQGLSSWNFTVSLFLTNKFFVPVSYQ